MLHCLQAVKLGVYFNHFQGDLKVPSCQMVSTTWQEFQLWGKTKCYSCHGTASQEEIKEARGVGGLPPPLQYLSQQFSMDNLSLKHIKTSNILHAKDYDQKSTFSVYVEKSIAVHFYSVPRSRFCVSICFSKFTILHKKVIRI